MTDKQPEALRLADALEQQFPLGTAQHYLDGEAAAELRRLYAENEALRKMSFSDKYAALMAENERLEASLRWHIRTYRVSDETWNPEEEVTRLMALEMKGETK